MVFKFKNYRIKSYENGFVSQQKIGNQWKVIGYYQNLKNAIKYTFEYRVLTETTNNIIDATEKASLRLESIKLIEKIDLIANDIEKAIKDGQR